MLLAVFTATSLLLNMLSATALVSNMPTAAVLLSNMLLVLHQQTRLEGVLHHGTLTQQHVLALRAFVCPLRLNAGRPLRRPPRRPELPP
ncbi:hypothetical protein PF006_g11125 [Phytophthora fragariae]|uniref:ABC transmembrane type-1 domain-containing protein n=1 Tax=Phytophthora fragariae TaxID=53985 RepID=A0A6A3TXF9_9STRA|nr:hypothetical protein PF006_g11125 [Phytophthora fragariae]